MSEAARIERTIDPKRRAFWLRNLHQWHWISSAVCLVGIVLFSATGITLNHAAQIEAKPQVVTRTAQLPQELLAPLAAAPDGAAKAPLPPLLRDWLARELDVRIDARAAEWSSGEIYVSLPRAGGDAWLSIDTGSGEVIYERTDRGWISWLNDLHKGRNTGAVWAWFIDLIAVACLVFAISGFFLLQMHARQRPLTWPLVGLGLVAMALVAILFIH